MSLIRSERVVKTREYQRDNLGIPLDENIVDVRCIDNGAIEVVTEQVTIPSGGPLPPLRGPDLDLDR